MIDEHVAWHAFPGNPSAGGRSIDPFPRNGAGPAPGSGEEFLVWHGGFVERFHEWVESLPEDQRPPANIISPWEEIPQMLKMSMLGWRARLANEERDLSDMSNFETLDELGQFLEWSLHGFLHNAASGMWREQILLSFESPRSTYFWQLHGLIDRWREQWVEYHEGEVIIDPPPPLFTPLHIDSDPIEAAIEEPSEGGRFSFVIDSAKKLVVQTSGSSDTVMYIAGPNDQRKLHSSDDDGGQNYNASINAEFMPGEYFVYVVLYDQNRTGSYAISAVAA